MNNPATIKQKATIATMCQKLGLDKEMKKQLVNDISYGRTTTSKELTIEEAQTLILHLIRTNRANDGGKRDKMVGKIFYYAHELGWTTLRQAQGDKPARRVADGQRVDEWMVKYSYLHKKLNRYTFEELPKLVSQLEAFYKKTLNK